MKYNSKKVLFNLVKTSPLINNKFSIKERLNLFKYVSKLSENNCTKILEDTIKIPKTNPKIQKIITVGLHIVCTTIPLPGLRLAIFNFSDINKYKCMVTCIRNRKIELCNDQCKYEALKWTVDWIEDEITKCDNNKKPYKCKKVLLKMLKPYSRKLASQEIMYKSKKRILNYKKEAL